MHPVYSAYPRSGAWLPRTWTDEWCDTGEPRRTLVLPRTYPASARLGNPHRSHHLEPKIPQILCMAHARSSFAADVLWRTAGLVQLDVCLDGPHPGEEEAVILEFPGLPTLAQLSLVWKGGRPDSVDVNFLSLCGCALCSCVPTSQPMQGSQVTNRCWQEDSCWSRIVSGTVWEPANNWAPLSTRQGSSHVQLS